MRSCKAVYSIATAVFCVVLAVTGTSAVWAQARTTPVEVKNLIGIDPTKNTVQAQQLGTWTINLGNTPAVTQSGEWNVGITGTPNVNVANTPTVNISGANNTVKAPTQWNKVRLWTTDQVLANGANCGSPSIQTAGYKEIRAYIASDSSSANLRVYLHALAGDSVSTPQLAVGNFAPPANFISLGANFLCTGNQCIFSFPVMSDVMDIRVVNITGGSVTVYSFYSWVYLVN